MADLNHLLVNFWLLYLLITDINGVFFRRSRPYNTHLHLYFCSLTNLLFSFLQKLEKCLRSAQWRSDRWFHIQNSNMINVEWGKKFSSAKVFDRWVISIDREAMIVFSLRWVVQRDDVIFWSKYFIHKTSSVWLSKIDDCLLTA